MIILVFRAAAARIGPASAAVNGGLRGPRRRSARAGSFPHSGDFEEPGLRRAFAHGRTSTRSRIIEGRARKTAGDSVPMEQWVGTISFWYSTG